MICGEVLLSQETPATPPAPQREDRAYGEVLLFSSLLQDTIPPKKHQPLNAQIGLMVRRSCLHTAIEGETDGVNLDVGIGVLERFCVSAIHLLCCPPVSPLSESQGC